ncbi:MAG: efflux RND transporter periplasmic adaptor subunit [Colwellia sp.]|nr:efflux RND transporter periplasmic adaptor subunit [Colwellia sp.]
MNTATNTAQVKTRRMVQLRYVLLPIAIIFLALVVVSILGALAPKPAKKPPEIKAPLVEVMKLVREDVTFTIASQGNIVPRTQTILISEVSGAVTYISEKFNVGGFFKKGEVLLNIDDITYRVAVLQAQARLDAAQAGLIEEQARAAQKEDEWLLTGRALAEAPILALRIPQLQQAKADVKAAQANLQEAEIKLKRTIIIAPYDAILKSKSVDIGQYVSMGSVLASTFAVDFAEVRLPIKQKDVLFLNLPKVNQSQNTQSPVNISYQLGNEIFSIASKLVRYEGEVDSASRVHYVVAQIDDPYQIKSNQINSNQRSTNNAPALRVGMYVNAKISGKVLTDIVAIPRGAVYGAKTIRLANEGHLFLQEISILRSDANYVYTRDVIAQGMRLILTKLESSVDGMTLRIAAEQGE